MSENDPDLARRLNAEARELAHDLDNLLNPLGLQIALLERLVGDNPRCKELLSNMRDTLQRTGTEVGRLRRFGEDDGAR